MAETLEDRIFEILADEGYEQDEAPSYADMYIRMVKETPTFEGAVRVLYFALLEEYSSTEEALEVAGDLAQIIFESLNSEQD